MLLPAGGCQRVCWCCPSPSLPELRQCASTIAQYKQTRVFYQNATARILVDSPSVSVIQYADADLGHCEILVFTKTVRALELRLYPIVDQSARYRYRDAFIDGSDITENGILASSLQDNSCEILKLTREA